MNKAIKRFIESNVFQRRQMVRVGFELETQETEGLTASDDGEIDHDAANEAIDERVSDIIGSELEDHLGQSLLDKVRDAVFESVQSDFDYSDYTSSSIDDIKNQIDDQWIEVGKDNSVDGFEFRTIGGLKYSDALAASKDVFRLSHKIDGGCSFHVHVSIPGVKHSYGTRFQIALVEFLIEHADRLPLSVRERFQFAPLNQYIKGMVSSRNKYSFVHAHEQGTWEFRCFGNVQNHAGATACINLAIEAMAYAYRVTKLGMPCIVDRFDGDVETLFTDCLIKNHTVSFAVRSARLNNVKHEQPERLSQLTLLSIKTPVRLFHINAQTRNLQCFNTNRSIVA